jgi:hypothetical protein
MSVGRGICFSQQDTDATFISLQRKAAEKAEKPARKAKKDPNAPKRALSAYMFFSQDWRERIKTENPDAGFGMFLFHRACLHWLTLSPQAKWANSSEPSGRSSTRMRRRYVPHICGVLGVNVDDSFPSLALHRAGCQGQGEGRRGEGRIRCSFFHIFCFCSRLTRTLTEQSKRQRRRRRRRRINERTYIYAIVHRAFFLCPRLVLFRFFPVFISSLFNHFYPLAFLFVSVP